MIGGVALVVALATTAGWWIPQVRRTGADVAPATWLMMAANAAVWGIWAVVSGQWLFAAVQGVQLVGCVAIASRNGVVRRDLAASVPLVPLIGLAAVPATSGVAAIAASVWLRVPQLVRARHHATGVSGSAWLLNMVSNGSWAVWGVSVGEPTVVVGCAIAAAGSAAVAITVATSHRRHPRPTTP